MSNTELVKELKGRLGPRGYSALCQYFKVVPEELSCCFEAFRDECAYQFDNDCDNADDRLAYIVDNMEVARAVMAIQRNYNRSMIEELRSKLGIAKAELVVDFLMLREKEIADENMDLKTYWNAYFAINVSARLKYYDDPVEKLKAVKLADQMRKLYEEFVA